MGENPKCKADTGGTCRFFSCHASRGETTCVNHRCMCKPGFCSENGVCVADVGAMSGAPSSQQRILCLAAGVGVTSLLVVLCVGAYLKRRPSVKPNPLLG